MSVGAARIEEGREQWLSDLYQAHAGAVRAYCRRFLNSAEDAADATHEVFVRAVGSLNAPAHSPQARRWLITVAQNYCLDLMRRRRRMQSALTVLASDGEPQYDSEADVVNRRLLDAVLNQLGPRERQALWQSAIEHRSIGEIAASIGISYMAAAQLLHRARKHATAVAAKLATILGLAGANALRKRPRTLSFVQALAALAVVPVVIAVATPSSNGHAAGLQQTTRVSAAASHRKTASAAPTAQLIDAVGPDRSQRHLHLLFRRLPSTVQSLVGAVSGAVQQLMTQLPSTKLAAPTSPPLPNPPVPTLLPTPLPTPPSAP